MGVGLGDLLQIIDFQEYLGEQMLNVYYYRYTSTPTIDDAIYGELLDDFLDTVVVPVAAIQSEDVMHTYLQIKNLSTNVQFAELDTDVPGGQSATDTSNLPSFISLGFQLVHDSLVTRSGYKRIGGLIESIVSGNEYTGAGSYTDAIETGLNAPLHAGIIEVAFPIIPKRPLEAPVGTDYLYSSVASVNFKGVGTQNTRKAGRGI